MAKKAELLEKAAKLQLTVSENNTIAEIEAAIAEAESGTPEDSKSHDTKDKDVIAEREAVVAKAGKRSQKALDEAAEKAEKEARKEAGDTTPQSDDARSQSLAHAWSAAARSIRKLRRRLRKINCTALTKR